MGKAERAEPSQQEPQPHLCPRAGGELTKPGRQARLWLQKLACFLEDGLGPVCEAGTMPMVALLFQVCPCHPIKGACTQPLTYLGRKDVDSSVFQNTREQNHKEPPKLASAHWQPVRDSSLVAKIAPGIVEEREG